MIPPHLAPTPPPLTRARLIIREHRHAARWWAGRTLRALADVLDPPRVLPEGVWRVRHPIPYTEGSAVPYLSDVPRPAAEKHLMAGGQIIVQTPEQ